ncbi:MAG: M6 family metalloprotease domain-containing protein [Prevotella sp.]|nr:M6 family metalloprotease domain-containing protein [Prevotella sp.]
MVIATAVMAVPAKPGQWKTIKLTDGTEVRAQLSGDEHVHFWVAEDGSKYVKDGDSETYVVFDDETIAARSVARRSKMKTNSRLRAPRKTTIGERTHFFGQKKGIVILVQFTDVKYKSGNNLAKYKRILNEAGYSEGNFKGSVADYFKDQSANQFELDFDVVGPYTLQNNQSYYGRNDSQGNDMNAEDMIVEACKKADAEVNFADYDWDGDGEVDQVFVVYAGKGEADGGSSNTIWPHMWMLEEANKSLTLDAIKINTYACSSELSGSGFIDGIGTFCHEFSHCMGFPDFYDITYNSGWMAMDNFDLMCGGSYLGDGFVPCGYTAYEKMMCSWQEPIVLADNDTIVQNIQPMSNHGETFIIFNDAHPDEYYMLENRQKTGWDADYPSSGLMITHVDFDFDIWQANVPNTKITNSEAAQYGLPAGKGNDHQRMSMVCADNRATKYTTSNDLYPYNYNDSLTATSKPAATLFNKNSKGTKVLQGAILDITKNANGTMNFVYRSGVKSDDPGNDDPGNDDPGNDDPGNDHPVDGVVFLETFDQCAGTGGNDGLWSGGVAASAFNPDNEGWTMPLETPKWYGGSQCAKFGTTSVMGIVTTPAFNLSGEATLTFKAGAWNASVDGTSLQLEADGATVTPSEFEIAKGNWTECTATLKGTGAVKVTFIPVKRFFLDEVSVTEATTTAIQNVNRTLQSDRIYTIDGRYVGTDKSTLIRGIYIVNGKKFVK